jgi:hypothetical protein
MGRDYLAHSIGDAINVILAAASSNEVLAAPNPDRLRPRRSVQSK